MHGAVVIIKSFFVVKRLITPTATYVSYYNRRTVVGQMLISVNLKGSKPIGKSTLSVKLGFVWPVMR